MNSGAGSSNAPDAMHSAVARRPLNRLMLAIDGEPCRFGCTYCFAQFVQYEQPRTLSEVEARPELSEHIDVIYPACDTDLFARRDFESVIGRVTKLRKSISISTKASVGRRAIAALQTASSELSRFGAVVKVGVSISTKYSVPEIEPRTPGYRSRLNSLARLRDAGLPNALVLRPLLADVSDREYEEVLRDCAGITDRVLLGDEWLDAGDRFRASRGADASPVVLRGTVNWARNEPQWLQRHIPGRAQGLEAYGTALGLKFFDSDSRLMEDVLGSE